MTMNLPEGSPNDEGGVYDPSLVNDWLLGGHLRAHLVPEDPDDRQYWLWDVDDLPTEKCEHDAAD